MRSPLHIEPGLDGAEVQLQTVHAVRPFTAGFALYQALGFVLLFSSMWAFGAMLLGAGLILTAWRLRERARDRTLRLTVTPTEVRFQGRPVQVRVDYQYIWVDQQRHTIDGGLTRKEHTRLTTLITRRDRGDSEDIDVRLARARALRE